MKPAIDDARLHAYVDGHLAPVEQAAVEAFLRDDAAAQARVRAWQAQNLALHRAFDEVLQEPQAPGLIVAAAARRPAWVLQAAALAAALAIGAAIGYFGRGLTDRSVLAPALVRQAVAAYAAYVPEVRHPVEVGAAEQQHLVAWLSKRLAAPLRAPDLQSAGYALLGGRLLPPAGESGQTPVALLMYENPQGKRLTLLVRREASNTNTAFRFAQQGSTRVFYWIDGPFGYALTGELEREALAQIARSVYQQLNP